MSSQSHDPLDVDGPAAPPRQNGELVFTAPWQSRMFATTMRLSDSGRIEWEQFRAGLIAQIAAHEQTLTDNAASDVTQWDGYDYWGCWQRALEELLNELSVISTAELDSTAEVLAARPPGHDHDHDHDHDHGDHDHHDHGDHGHHH